MTTKNLLLLLPFLIFQQFSLSDSFLTLPSQLLFHTYNKATNYCLYSKNIPSGDEHIIEIEESQLLEAWLKSGRSKSSFDTQQAIMLSSSSLDNDDEEGFQELSRSSLSALKTKSLKLQNSDVIKQLMGQAVVPVVSSENSNLYSTKSVGIDLGTTYSAVSLIEFGKPKIIPVKGSRIIPSVVAYVNADNDKQYDIEVLVGELAQRQQVTNPKNTFSSIKRLIGRTKDQLIKLEDKISLSKIGKKVGEGIDNRIFSGIKRSINEGNETAQYTSLVLDCPVLHRRLLPEEISAEVLKTLLDAAHEYLNSNQKQQLKETRIENAVITVPAYFLPDQCAATERAGYLAGLKKVKLVREPEAAALAYGLTKKSPQIVLVFDLGGGTFDVSVLEVGGGFVEVIATSGDSHLGGDDFNAVLVNWLIEQINSEHGFAVGNAVKGNVFATSRLFEAAEKGKIRLSSQNEVTISIPFIHKDISVNHTITRKKFEYLCKPLFQRLLKPVREVAVIAGVNLPGESGLLGIASADYDTDDASNDSDIVDEDAGTGKDTLDPSESSKFFVDEKLLKYQQKQGQANARTRNKAKGETMKQVSKLQKMTGDSSLTTFPGGQALNEVILVGGSTRIPAVQRLISIVTGLVPRQTVNPDEAVSLGAAIMAGIIDGDVSDMKVMSAWQAAIVRTLYEQKASFANSGVFKENPVEGADEPSSSNTKTVSRLRSLRRKR